MAITQVGSTTTTGDSANVTSRAPAVPTGAAANDVAFVFLDIWEAADPTVTVPSGFTQLYKVTNGTGAKSYCYWKRLTGSDTGTYSFSWTGSQWANASCSMLRGVKLTGDPVGANFNTATAGGTPTTFPSVAVTPAYTPGLLWHGYSEQPGTHTPPTSPAGFTEASDVDCATDAIYLPSSGTSFTVTGATTTVGGPLVSALLAVEAAAGGAIDLVVGNALQAQTVDSPTLAQIHVLVVAGATQAQTADSPALVQAHQLTVADATQAHTADNVTVNVAVGLVVADAAHSQTVDNVALIQVHVLTVQAAAQAQSADTPALSQVHVLVVQNALHAQTATTVAFTPYATAASGNGRYIVDQNGVGYLSLFDTIWPMVQQAGRDSAGDWQADMDHWVDTRAGQGFAGLKFNLFGNVISGANADLLTFDDVSPFNTTNPATADPTLWNETYWTRVDYLIDAAAAAGMTCWVHVAYKDDVAAPSGTGWLQGHSNGEYTSFGTILGNRYKNRPNIVWVYGGDYFDESAAQLELVADAVTAAGDAHLVTAQYHADGVGGTVWTTSRRDQAAATLTLGSAVATVEGLYIYFRLYEAAEVAYNTSPALPIVFYDGYYDGGVDDLRLRRDLGWSLTCGSYSSHYGSEALWAQPVGWRNNMTAEPPLINMLGVVAGLPGWEALVPDFADTFITGGKGTSTSTVTAAKTAAGDLAVVYNPVASNTITLAVGQMVAGYTARWVDPANGASVDTSTGSTYTRATANSAGSTDWFLILEAPTEPPALTFVRPTYTPMPRRFRG